MNWKTNTSSMIEPQARKSQPPIKAVPSGPSVVQSENNRYVEQAPKHESALPPQAPKGPISAKFQDKAKVQRVAKRSSVPPVHLKSSKPWPGSGSKSSGSTDELIKHMSNVPSYLHKAMHTNGGDNIQGKALNVGVLEWGALERFTGKMHSACATAGVTSLLSAKSSAPTPKQQQQQPDHSRDLDPDHSSFVINYRSSISRRNSKNATDNGEEKCDERGRRGENKSLSPYSSPGLGGHIEKVQRRFSGQLFGDVQVTDRCARVPYSCPLPREDDDICTATTNSCSSSSNTSSLLRESTEVVSWEFTSHNQNTNGLSARRSLAEPPPVASKGKMSMVETAEREAASSKRGRQSPLRRILDPLFKPRNAASSSHHESTPVLVRRPPTSTFSLSNKKKDCHTGPSTCTENSDSITNPSFHPQSDANLHLQQVEKIQPLTRQALVQLAWKKGLPVFMLSSGESDILGATVRRKCMSDTIDHPDFSYSIFTLQESKTKGGAVWIRQGSKGKKHLVSNTIGEVRVSTSKSKCCNNSDICHVSREFVLVGPQLIPAANTERAVHEIEMESPVNMELAAIVTSPPTNGCFCNKTASAGSVTAILPSGIHGASARGEPSPLIERWRSGGQCDCGGWDEGCRLSLLSLEFNSDGSKSNWAETQACFELFPQGRLKEEGHAFSMICFKEGLYTVEFKSSIPLLQAFAICISLLHSRTPVKQEIQQEKTLGATKGGPPTSYMQCHPPLSPVGRA